MFLPYNPHLKARAAHLRNHSTHCEIMLWNRIKHGQIGNFRFLRQRIIGNFIVDFYCPKMRLAIEIDGSSHNNKKDLDAFRQEQLEMLGISVLRFSDHEVKNQIDFVLTTICSAVFPPSQKGAPGHLKY